MSNRSIEVNNQYPNLKFQLHEIQKLFYALDTLDDFSIPQGDLSIAFVSDPAITQIHDDFMSDPSPTDVITFPGDPQFQLAGEIIVSVDHALTNAKEHNTPFQNELTLYLIHGWLHLAGLDDLNDHDRQDMRNAEALILDFLKKINTLPNFSLNPL